MNTLIIDLLRLKQCMTCANNPSDCGCDDSDEDSKGMCKKWAEREND